MQGNRSSSSAHQTVASPGYVWWDALHGAPPGCNLTPVMHRIPRFLAALGFAITFASPAPSAQTKAAALPRTPDGHPDLQGIWDFRSATPLERPARFAG